MTRDVDPSIPTRNAWAVAAAAGVVLWRLAAFEWPSSFVSLPGGLRLPLALMGLAFLACGLAAWWWRPDRWTAVFLVYCLGGGVHWGGAVGAPHARALGLFFLYLALTALGDAALLHLALIYPEGGPLARGWRAALYAPAAVALLLAPFAGALSEALLRTLAGALLLVANLFSLVAGVVFVVRLFTVDRALRRAARLPLIVAAMVVASVVALLGAGGALPGEPEGWNLVLVVIPICLAVALGSRSPDAVRFDAVPESNGAVAARLGAGQGNRR